MWGNNNVGIHTFVHDEKLNQNTTSKLKGTKFVTSKKCGATTMLGYIPLYLVEN
jgi:hypothetical protein